MKHFMQWLDEHRNAFDGEEGFTLIELMIVVVVLGVLIAIAVPVYATQQRAALDATVQHDVKSNSTTMAPGDAGRLYASKSAFMERSVATKENVTDYFVNASFTESCTQTSREYSADDVTVYHFLSSVGYMRPGPCPPLGDGQVGDDNHTPDPGDPTWEPEEPEVPGGNPETDGLTQMGGLKFTTTYQPQTNHLTFCWTVKIEVDPDYPHNTPNPQINWEYKTDLNAPPFWGLNPYTDLNSTYGYSTKSVDDKNIWTVKGEGWNDVVSYSQPRTIGYCSTSVPEPPLNPETYSYTISASPSNNNWWACLDFRVTSHLPYPTPWKITLDLSKYFRSIDGKVPQFINLEPTHVGGNVWEVTGIGWNHYVADIPGFERIYSTSICYYPEGQQW
jgi:prepilin-type N-terminal cleavage/methylation domain-containing protein